MVLKKQTVWLLTMLSLMLVLGVYYFYTGDDQAGGPGELTGSETADVDTNETSTEEDLIASISGNVNFEEARLKLNEKRSKDAENYTSEAANDENSPEEKVAANDKSLEILAISNSEEDLETFLKGEGYSDVFVMSDSDTVQIMVQANEHSKKEANEIMTLAREKLQLKDQAEVTVKFEAVEE